MSRIVIDARIISTPSGRYAERLVEYLQDVDQDNDYIVLVKPKDLDYWQPRAKNFQVIANPIKEFTFAEQTRYISFLKQLKPDLVHFAMFQQPIFYRGPKLTTLHDLTLLDFVNKRPNEKFFKSFYKYRVKPLVFRLVIRRMLTGSSTIITPSHYVAKDTKKRLKLNNNFVVTYESSDLLSKKPKAYLSAKDQKFLLYVGNTPPYKNLKRLIEAMPAIHHHTGAKLLLVGKANDFTPSLQAKAQELGLDETVVEWTGFVSDDELAWLYQHCQAYIVPSLSEGFGLPGLEAMKHGAAVVSSNATCLPEVYQDGAHYFDPYDVDDMTNQIVKVIEDEKLAKQLKSTAKNVVMQYSWSKMAKKTYAEYLKILDF